MQSKTKTESCTPFEIWKNAHTHTNIAATRVNYGKWQIVQTQHTAQHNICVSNLVFVIIVGAIDAHTLAALCTRATFRFRYSEYFVSHLSLSLSSGGSGWMNKNEIPLRMKYVYLQYEMRNFTERKKTTAQTLIHVYKTLSINESKQKQGITNRIPLLMHMKWRTKAFSEQNGQRKKNLDGKKHERSEWEPASQLKTIYVKSQQMNEFWALNTIVGF